MTCARLKMLEFMFCFLRRYTYKKQQSVVPPVRFLYGYTKEQYRLKSFKVLVHCTCTIYLMSMWLYFRKIGLGIHVPCL